MSSCDFSYEHRTKIRTNNVIERMNREIRRRTRVVGAFPDGSSALMLVCARLRHVAGTQWGSKQYMSMKHLEAMAQELPAGSAAARSQSVKGKTNGVPPPLTLCALPAES